MNELEQSEDIFYTNQPKKRKTLLPLLVGMVLILSFACTAFAAVLWQLNQPAFEHAETINFTVEDGDSVRDIANTLESVGAVKSASFLYFILATQFDATKIKASNYILDEPLTTYEVAERLISGDFDTDLESITVFEGESVRKIAERLEGNVPWFDTEIFIELTVGKEGQLFPDTYFVPEFYTTEQFVELLHESYVNVISDYADTIEESDFTEDEVVTLASIVEREANSKESMQLVAGIFQNRLDIGMALQADASIEYVLDEGLHELAPGQLAESLREVDSPYNTYLYPGFPPTPIGNPGRTAIEAVLFPTNSDYLYYITGNDGEFYYAETYNQHLRNIDIYLR